MERTRRPEPHLAFLPLGTVVESWRLVAWAGCGVYGAVYRAVSVDSAHAEPVALKLARLPEDPRFAREVELLSRTKHPGVPRLLGSGQWQHPSRPLLPFIVMEWVEGTPLYGWAREHKPDSQQVLRMLAQLARALEALHAHGSIHRDVKGDNILVRHSDGYAMLMDFGSGIHPGASTLTPPGMFPGTQAYRAPEAWLFSLRSTQDDTPRYSASAVDDLYALGVTAYRLVTGQYPVIGEPFQVTAPRALNPSVDPQLDALILRMLSLRSEARGTAAELARALEKAASKPLKSAAPARARQQAPAPSATRRTHVGLRWSALAVLAAGLALNTWAWWATRGREVDRPTVAQREAGSADQPDAGTVGLGTAASMVSTMHAPDASVPEVMAEDSLPEPLPGQTRPDNKGRCPGKKQIALNRACWILLSLDREECEENGYSFTTQCYAPVFAHPRKRQPTSHPGSRP